MGCEVHRLHGSPVYTLARFANAGFVTGDMLTPPSDVGNAVLRNMISDRFVIRRLRSKDACSSKLGLSPAKVHGNAATWTKGHIWHTTILDPRRCHAVVALLCGDTCKQLMKAHQTQGSLTADAVLPQQHITIPASGCIQAHTCPEPLAAGSAPY
eukprot:5558157-Amphidinium_carterae.1